MKADLFLALADRQISAPRRARLCAAETRAEKCKAEREEQLAQWRRQRREQQATILRDGPYAQAARELAVLLDTLRPNDAETPLKHVTRGPWRKADRDTRALVLDLIDGAIVEMREACGLPPFDDPLPNEEPNVFLILREWLA